MKFFLIVLFFLSITAVASAHSGGTDSRGCHRDSSTGTTHCHGTSSGGVSLDPDVAYGLSYALSGVGILSYVIAVATDYAPLYVASILGYLGSEALAIAGFLQDTSHFEHFAALTTINIVGLGVMLTVALVRHSQRPHPQKQPASVRVTGLGIQVSF